jgi:hypothetical protein
VELIAHNENTNKPNDEVRQMKNIFYIILSFKIDLKKSFAALLQRSSAYYKHN